MHISLQSDEIFHIKFKLQIFGFCDAKTTSSGNFRLIFELKLIFPYRGQADGNDDGQGRRGPNFQCSHIQQPYLPEWQPAKNSLDEQEDCHWTWKRKREYGHVAEMLFDSSLLKWKQLGRWGTHALKFSQVLGATSARISITTLLRW